MKIRHEVVAKGPAYIAIGIDCDGGQRCFEQSKPFLSHGLAAAPGGPHAMKELHPTGGGQPREERTYPAPTRD